MPVTRPSPEKLAAVLKGVSPAVARFVIHEIEVNRRRGQDEPIYEMVLSTVRGVIRESGEKVERVKTAKRLFCALFEEFLVDRTLEEHQRGRLDRASIAPIWDWLVSGWGPRDLGPIVEKLEIEFKRDNPPGVAPLVVELCAQANAAIRAGLLRVQGDQNEQRRLAVRLGGTRVLKDVVQLQRILMNMQALARVRAALAQGTIIRNDEHAEQLARAMRQGIADVPRSPELPIAVMMGRLARPIEIVRLVVIALGQRDGTRISSSPFAPAVDLLIYDMGLLGLEILESVRRRKGVAATLYWLSRLHEYSTEMLDRADISLRSEWGKKLLAIRNSVSAELDREITGVPPLLKELYRRRPDFAKGSSLRDPDTATVFDVTHGLVLLVGCRPYLDQLSLNQTISRTDSEVRRYLRIVADALVADIRNHEGEARACARAWFETAVQFTRIVFGEEDAKLLARSGDVASRAVAS
jgi:hypothetical protein